MSNLSSAFDLYLFLLPFLPPSSLFLRQVGGESHRMTVKHPAPAYSSTYLGKLPAMLTYVAGPCPSSCFFPSLFPYFSLCLKSSCLLSPLRI